MRLAFDVTGLMKAGRVGDAFFHPPLEGEGRER